MRNEHIGAWLLGDGYGYCEISLYSLIFPKGNSALSYAICLGANGALAIACPTAQRKPGKARPRP